MTMTMPDKLTTEETPVQLNECQSTSECTGGEVPRPPPNPPPAFLIFRLPPLTATLLATKNNIIIIIVNNNNNININK